MGQNKPAIRSQRMCSQGRLIDRLVMVQTSSTFFDGFQVIFFGLRIQLNWLD
jgi:hypothetical protein